jgi:hypothetical protein
MELQSNVVFAKCTVLDDANADTSQPSRVHAFERVADERNAALAVHAVLHSEVTRDRRVMFQLGLLNERDAKKLHYTSRATLVCGVDDAFAGAVEHRIVDAAPIVVARIEHTNSVLVWSDDVVRRFDLNASLQLVSQWPQVAVAHDESAGPRPVLLGIEASSATTTTVHSNESLRARLPLQSAMLAGVSAVTALEWASAVVEAERGAAHHWVRLTMRGDGSIERTPGWFGVLPNSVAALGAAVCVDEAQRSAWIVSESGTLFYCCNEQVVRTAELGERFGRVQRLVPLSLDDAPALVVVGLGGVVATCRIAAPSRSNSFDVTVIENVRSVVRLSHDRALFELANNDAVLGSIVVVSNTLAAPMPSQSSNNERVVRTISAALASRVCAAGERLDSVETLLLAKRDLIESRIALLEGKAARSVNVPSLQVVTVVGGDVARESMPAAIECDTEDDGVTVDNVEFQFSDAANALPMRARCRVHVNVAPSPGAVVGDVSLTVLVRGNAVQSTSYVETEFLSPGVPQVAAIAAGGLAVSDVCDLRVACEVASGAGANNDGVTILVRWQWFRITADDGRIESVLPRRVSQRLVALDSPLCRVVPRDVEFLPHATTLYVLPTSRRIEPDRLAACVASELRASGRVRVRTVFRSGNDAVVDASGQMGGGAMLQLRCASSATGASVVERLRALLRAEFDADVEEDAHCDGTAERIACVALLHECQLLRALLEASRAGTPVELARVTEARVATDVCLYEVKS